MTTPIEDQIRTYFTTVDRMRGHAPEPVVLRSVDGDPSIVEHDVIGLVPNQDHGNRPARLWLVAAAAAVVVLLTGWLALDLTSDPAPAPADEPQPTTTSTSAASEEEATDLGFPGSTIDPGRYSTFLMGVPVELTVDDSWAMSEARAGMVALHSPIAGDALDVEVTRWVFLTRVGGWFTSEEARDPAHNAPGSIDPNELDGWIDDNDVIVSNWRDTEVGGRAATVIDVRVDPDATGAPLDFPRDLHTLYADGCTERTAPCVWYRSVSEASEVFLGPRPDPLMHAGQVRRMWLIPLGAFDPLLIEAIAPTGDVAWLDEFENTTIASLDLGEDAPPIE